MWAWRRDDRGDWDVCSKVFTAGPQGGAQGSAQGSGLGNWVLSFFEIQNRGRTEENGEMVSWLWDVRLVCLWPEQNCPEGLGSVCTGPGLAGDLESHRSRYMVIKNLGVGSYSLGRRRRSGKSSGRWQDSRKHPKEGNTSIREWRRNQPGLQFGEARGRWARASGIKSGTMSLAARKAWWGAVFMVKYR